MANTIVGGLKCTILILVTKCWNNTCTRPFPYIQVAYDSSSILLSDRRRFVNFFRTYPSDITFGPDVLSFLRFYGWNRIMFVTEQEELFTGVSEITHNHVMHAQLISCGITCIYKIVCRWWGRGLVSPLIIVVRVLT